MELRAPLAKPPVIDRIGAVPIPPPNPFRKEELDYSGTDIPYKYRGLGDVEFRADIQKHVNNSPLAISALADIERRTGGDYGKLIDFTRPGVFKNLKGEDVQVGRTYKSKEGKKEITNKGWKQTPGAYYFPDFREEVAELEGRDIDDIPAITLNPDKVDTFEPGEYKEVVGYDKVGKNIYKPIIETLPKLPWEQVLRHELDHYGIDSLLNIGSEGHYFEDPFLLRGSNLHAPSDAIIKDYYGKGYDNIPHEHDMINPLDVIQGEKEGFDTVGLGFATPEDAKNAELLRYERQFGHTPWHKSPAIHFRNRLDELALKRLEELGIPKTPINIEKVSWLNKLGQWFGLGPPDQPRLKYGL